MTGSASLCNNCNSCGSPKPQSCPCDKNPCDTCGHPRNQCGCCNYTCAFKTVAIIAVVLITLLGAFYFTGVGINNINIINADNPRIFDNELSLARAFDYLKANFSMFWVEILLMIALIGIICCINSELGCKDGIGKIRWWCKISLTLFTLLLAFLAHGLFTVVLTTQSSHFAGVVGIIGAIIGFFAVCSLGWNWKTVIVFTASIIMLFTSIYLVALGPSFRFISTPGVIAAAAPATTTVVAASTQYVVRA